MPWFPQKEAVAIVRTENNPPSEGGAAEEEEREFFFGNLGDHQTRVALTDGLLKLQRANDKK